MGDPLELIENVGLNLVTGGLYSLAKSVEETIKTGDPSKLLSQGLDIGGAALGNQIAVDLGGPLAGTAFNAAGGLAGAAGASGVFSSLPGFAPGGVAPLAAAPSAGGVPVTAGAMNSATAADVAGATVTGPVGPIAAPATQALPAGMGALEPIAGAAPTAATAPAAMTPMAAGGLPAGMANSMIAGPSTAGIAELTNAAPALANAASTAGWFNSLSPVAQMALVMGGGQMLTGAMGGLFTGVSAQKKLELEQLMNQQREQQVQYKNKNNAYAPLLTFKPQPGLANTPGAV